MYGKLAEEVVVVVEVASPENAKHSILRK